MSKHLFNNTCEIDNTFIIQKEEESKKEFTTNIKIDEVIEIFLNFLLKNKKK